MKKTKDLGMSTLATFAGIGVFFVIFLFVLSNHFGIEQSTLANFGSYFGGVLTPIGIFVGWISYYRSQESERLDSNYKLAIHTISTVGENNCFLLENAEKFGKPNSEDDYYGSLIKISILDLYVTKCLTNLKKIIEIEELAMKDHQKFNIEWDISKIAEATHKLSLKYSYLIEENSHLSSDDAIKSQITDMKIKNKEILMLSTERLKIPIFS